VVGLVGLTLTLVTHVLAVAGVDVSSRFPFVWAMHGAAILYFGCALLALLRSGYPTRLTLDVLRNNLPGWALVAGGLLFVYMLINTVVCASIANGGNADFVNGQYLLVSHAQVLAHLTEHEYHLHKA
jgi:hypothetical protein